MGTITISIDDALEGKLREWAARLYGSSRGGLSRVIEAALASYFVQLERRSRATRVYRALKEGRVVAEAGSLEELAEKLKSIGLEPRGLRIVCESPLKPVARGGYRMRRVGG